LKDYQPSAMVADVEPLPEAPPSARVAMPDVDADGPAIASSGLTVGDMGFDLNPAIQHWVNYYTATTGGRRTMTIGLSRSQQYIEMARDEFRRAGVPEDLIWLAMVESVWNPTAVSPAAAGGLWQFIPKTAVEYGLTVERGNDERTDPVKQTRVAAEYLRDLYTLFGDWALAMAAYNSGEPRVMEAVVKNGRANFWELYEKQLLPKETRDYVPKILAAIKVVSEADTYGFSMDSLAVSSGQ
jgi:membrane-bound lytic murein transglycosylase D